MLPNLFIDVSKHQGEWLDPLAPKRKGIIGVFIRVTVGDYYTDPKWPEFYQKAVDNGYLVSGYHVMAPNDGYGRRITAAAQMSRFYDAVGSRKFTLPAVLDNELSRGEDNRWITSVVQSCFALLHGYQGFAYPLNYTNANFFNTYINWASSFLNYPLFVANYNAAAKQPILPRGYSKWALWQWSADGNGQGKNYGFTSHSIDLSRATEDFLATLGKPEPKPDKPLTLEERVRNLEARVAALEK